MTARHEGFATRLFSQIVMWTGGLIAIASAGCFVALVAWTLPPMVMKASDWIYAMMGFVLFGILTGVALIFGLSVVLAGRAIAPWRPPAARQEEPDGA